MKDKRQIEIRVTVRHSPNEPLTSLLFEVLNIEFSHMFSNEVMPEVRDRISEKLVEELMEDARLHILGTPEAKNAIFNEVTAKLIDRLAYLETKIENNESTTVR